uniref:Fimbrial protein n=1 Tax=Providencia stuartii TaxID=588 RepID=A0AAI9D7L8_PROST|nr:fimbrial protein [Providencia stuartii]
MFQLNKQYSLLVGLLLSLVATGTFASNMKLYGILLEPPACTIQDDNVIDVFFGKNVGIHRLDGINYTQDVDYKLVCAQNSKGWVLKLSVSGPQSNFDSAALQTNEKNLAIRITQNGQPFEINKPITITPTTPPAIKAVPIKRPGSTLTEGPFSVTATLLAEYQ